MPEGIQVPSTSSLASTAQTVGYAALGGVLADGASRLAQRFNLPPVVGPAVTALVVGSVLKGAQGDALASVIAFSSALAWSRQNNYLDFLEG